jgi:hypothetical protein
MGACPTCGSPSDGYDALARELRAARAWGSVVIRFKDGQDHTTELQLQSKDAAALIRTVKGER